MVDLQSLPSDVPQATFPSNVMDLVRNRFDGNYSAMARALGVHRVTVFDWANGKRRPSPASLVALAYCFGEGAMDWIVRRVEPADLHETRPIDSPVAEIVRPRLQRHAPETVRAHLSSVLKAGGFPPPSFNAVCRQLGVNQTVAKRRCPELAAEIMSNYKHFRTENKNTRERFRKIVVESAVNQLLTEGRTFSYNQLCKSFPRECPRVTNWSGLSSRACAKRPKMKCKPLCESP
jgi:hypothetical protein